MAPRRYAVSSPARPFVLCAVALLTAAELTFSISAHADPAPEPCREIVKEIDIGNAKQARTDVDTELLEADNRVLWRGGAPFYVNLDHASKQTLQEDVISLCRRFPYLTLDKAADRGIAHKTQGNGNAQHPGPSL